MGYFYYQDSLENTSHVTDAAGNLLERYTYSAFGQPSFFDSTSQPLNSSTYNIKHLFQGQLWTQETGLNDYRNRVELPVMGVFLQPDPVGFKGDAANVYRFCNNSAEGKKGSVCESRQFWVDDASAGEIGSPRSCPGELAWNLQARRIISSIAETAANRSSAMSAIVKSAIR